MARIIERPRAHRELEDIAVYIGRDRPVTARRFLAAVRRLYAKLAGMPSMVPCGSPRTHILWACATLPSPGIRTTSSFTVAFPMGWRLSTSFTEPATSYMNPLELSHLA